MITLRSVQTRKLAAPSESAILAATIAVLQDMEFNVDRIEKPLGVISASKVSDADDAGEKAGLFFLDLLCVAGGSKIRPTIEPLLREYVTSEEILS